MASTYVIDPETRHQSININVTNLTYAVDEVGSLPNWKTKLPFNKSKATENEFKSKVILNNVSFKVNSGQMLAIMGCSGSGKTSLLDVLACRNMGGEVRGDIELNGVKHTRGMIETYSAYVRQDDRLLQHLTVKETLMFVAQLKLPTRLSNREMQNKVDGVIAELGLSHVANTRVGGVDIRGISGGERRRVSIGVQLLLDPSILFLDEPTSGLDAFTANHMVQTLANLASNKRTVLLSIHQPRTDIFELFDLVLVLSAGKTVYFGEAKLMVDYFTTLGFPCPELTNPSDFYLDLATIDVTSVETEKTTSEILKNLVIAYELDKTTKSELAELEHSHQTQVSTLAGSMDNNSGYPGFFRQFQVLFRRHFRNIVIDYWFLIVQIIQSLTMSTILGSVFWNLSKDQLGMRDRFGLFFMTCVMYPYTVTLDVIGQSHRERHYLYFELQDKLYGHFAYNMAKVLAEIPFHVLFCTIYFTPAYFMANLEKDAGVFFTMYGVVILSVYASKSAASFAANLLPNYQLSSVTSNTLLAIFALSGGFFINLETLFSGLKWVSDISSIRWAFEAISVTGYQNLNFTCGEIDPKYCVRTGQEALEMYSFEEGKVWLSVTALSGIILTFQILAFVSLRFVAQKPYE